jgi:hypothetical protein
MGLRKSIRNLYWKRQQARRAAVASTRTLDWNWLATPYNRVALVSLLAASRPQGRYLEIGCDEDLVFRAVPARRKVGVDPARGGTARLTSDAYFSGSTETFDVIYIDGLHTYEQVRRDVVNALDRIAPGGWIVLHDMLPHDWIEAHSPRITRNSWTGDVWKAAFDMRATEGLDFRIVLIDNGCLVIRSPEPKLQLFDRRAEMAGATFDFLCDRVKELPLATWDEFRIWAGV